MNIEVTLGGTGIEVVRFWAPPRFVWVAPVSGTTTAQVDFAMVTAKNNKTGRTWYTGPTLDFGTPVPHRAMPDHFPAIAIRITGTAGDVVHVVAGEPLDLSVNGQVE